MSTDELAKASEVLRRAIKNVDDETTRDRLEIQADQLATLAARDRGPDHGRIARHQQKLKDLKENDPATTDAVDEANDHLNAYRETIDGV